MAHKIGFTNSPFPIKEGSEFDRELFDLKCRNFKVQVEVFQCKLELGDKEFTGVATSRVDIASRLPLNGFASHCFMDEADTMKKAVEMYAEKRNKGIGGEYNNWPSFRGHLYEKH